MKKMPRVLACHTNQVAQNQMAKRLGSAGIHTDCAGDTRQAESRLAGSEYDAVLLDLFLADMDGITFAGTLNGAFPELPVVILSSWPDPAIAAPEASWPGWIDSYTRHVRLLFALRVAASHAGRQDSLTLWIGGQDDCPENSSTGLAQQTPLVRVHHPYQLEEAISANHFDLVIYSPDQDAGIARDIYHILLDSVMPVPLIIHPGPSADGIVGLVRQAVEAEIPLPHHRNWNTAHRPGQPGLSDWTEFKTSEGIEKWESLNH